MGLNEFDDYFRKDTELQNYTKIGVKRIMFVSFEIKFTDSALRTHVESLGKPRDVNKRSGSLAW